jgi:hypothetical protein
MNCEDIRQKFVDYLTGELPAGDLADIRRHLTSCSPCREELEGLSAIWTKLGVLPQEQPSAALRTRFYERLEAYKEGLGKGRAKAGAGRDLSRWLGRMWALRPAVSFSAAAILIFLAGAVGYLAGGRGRAVDELRREVEDIRQAAAVSLLAQPSTAGRLRGISFTEQVLTPSRPTLDALLRTLDEDPNINVRLAAVDAIYLFAGQPGVKEGLLKSLARQQSPHVQVALIDLLVSIRERRAVEALKTLAANEKIDPDVRQKAESGIKELSL